MEGTLALMIPIIAVLVAGLVILVPVAGLTARFALKPMMDAFVAYRNGQGGQSEAVEALERRVARLEEEQRALQRSLASAMSGEPRDAVLPLEPRI